MLKDNVSSCESRKMSDCQIAVAAAIAKFGRVDILICCTSQGVWYFAIATICGFPAHLTLGIAIIGTVEELAASEQTQALVRDQFETNYFGPVNLIKAVLPQMRKQKSGHIMVLGGISMRDGLYTLFTRIHLLITTQPDI